jgi:antitoxin VapB
MARTKAFRSGNSQAVRIPAELAYSPADVELEICRHGDVITMFPVRRSLEEAVEKLLAMPKPARVERRRPIEVPFRKGE